MGNINVEVASILSHRTKQGMVELEMIELNDDNMPKQHIATQFDVTKAREIRDMLSEAIEAAISDTVIFKFFHEHIGMPEDKAAQILLEFRNLRQGSKNTVYPS